MSEPKSVELLQKAHNVLALYEEGDRLRELAEGCLDILEGQIKSRDGKGKPTRGAIIQAGVLFREIAKLEMDRRRLTLARERFEWEKTVKEREFEELRKERESKNPLKDADPRAMAKMLAEWRASVPVSALVEVEERLRSGDLGYEVEPLAP